MQPDDDHERRSSAHVLSPVKSRKLAKVPFVELSDGRVRGVASSGSDIRRVYVCSITAGDHLLNCSTNNNRPCGGFYGAAMCKHLRAVVEQAVVQYGFDRVARYLRVDVDLGAPDTSRLTRLGGGRDDAPAGATFARFLRHLAYLELPPSTEPDPDMHWFPAREAVR